jgi:flagellar basal body-associated protein FliL
MNEDAGGWMWLLMNVAFVVILAGALGYAVMAWRKRSAAARQAGDRATREIYHRRDPESR